MKSLQIAAIRHMPWLEDRHTLSEWARLHPVDDRRKRV